MQDIELLKEIIMTKNYDIFFTVNNFILARSFCFCILLSGCTEIRLECMRRDLPLLKMRSNTDLKESV